MDSTQLYRFKVIAECESISKAAEGLYISQPALSMMLRDLENELQCKLFLRCGHKLKINEDGKRLLAIANKVCYAIAEGEQEFKANASMSQNIYSCDHYYSAILPEFSESIPFNLFLHVIPNKDIASHMLESKMSSAICDDFYLKQFNTDDYIRRFLFQEDLYLYVPEGHRWEGRNLINITDIGDEPFCYSPNEGFSEWVNSMAVLNKVKLKYAMALDKTLSAMYMSCVPYPRFLSSRIAWNLDNLRCKKSRFVQIRGAYTQRDICLWYHKQNYSNIRQIIDGICSRSVELNNYIICFREKIDMPGPAIKIKHYFS